LGHEGGYSNDPDDVGGETYKGIARNYHSDWPGWAIIDNAKGSNNFPKNLQTTTGLEPLVKEFYKEKFWDKFWGDKIKNQKISNELFDTSVNMGIGRTVKFLQKSLNLLNRNGINYPDIVEDGAFGENTLKSLESCLGLGDYKVLYNILNVMQGGQYIESMTKNSTQEKYARGWFKRVDIIKQ